MMGETLICWVGVLIPHIKGDFSVIILKPEAKFFNRKEPRFEGRETWKGPGVKGARRRSHSFARLHFSIQ